MIRFTIPIKLESLANARLHWAAKARKVKAIRYAAAVFVLANVPKKKRTLPATVQLTRIYPKRTPNGGNGKPLDGHDNLMTAMKPVVDAIAEVYGVDDADPRWNWLYAQEQGDEYGCRVEIVR